MTLRPIPDLPPIQTPMGQGKTGFRDALLGSASTIPTGFDAERQAWFNRQLEAAGDDGERLVVLGIEEVRRTHAAMRALGMPTPPATITDTHTGAVICDSSQDDYLERYRAYMTLHPGGLGSMG